MLYLLFGSHSEKTRTKMHTLVDGLSARKPDAEVFRIEAEKFDSTDFEGLVFGQGLFEKKYIVVLDYVFENPEAKEVVLKQVKNIAQSENVFVVLESTIDAKTKKKLGDYAHKIEEHNRVEKKKTFNIFSLTDAFGARDKKKVWILYREAIEYVDHPKDIQSILFWYIKSLILAKTSPSAQSIGMKPFVYNKAKQSAEKYSIEELHRLSNNLLNALSHSRKGGDLENDLERIILSL